MKPIQSAGTSRFLLLAALLGLAACGGGGGGASAVGTIYYVDGSMTVDTGDGLSPATARRFIHTAVADAVAPATILVNAGDYRLSYQLGTQVVLKEGVSLYGGYNANFTARDPATYVTTIEDRSSTGGAVGNPNRAIEGDGVGTPITPATIVDGFTIQGSLQTGPTFTAAIFLSNGAAPTLQNNIIHGGSAINSALQGISYGIYVAAATPTIQNNTINGGSGYTACYGIYASSAAPTIQNNTIDGGSSIESYGLYNNQSSPRVQNNTIDGGSGSTSYGIYNFALSSSTVQNNTIHGGSGSYSYGLYNKYSSPTVQNNTIHGGSGTFASTAIFDNGADPSPANPRIENNIIFTRTGAGSVCIVESGLGASPTHLRNNNLSNCALIYSDAAAGCPGNADADNDSSTCTLAEMNALADIPGGVSGNIAVDSQFADIDGADNNINTMNDNNWHFSVGSPVSVTAGGLNGITQGWTFTTDKDGVSRPASGNPWSIGAYEPI